MAGTTAVEVPVPAAIVNESPRMKVQGSPEKSPHVLKMDSGEVKTSPQGKGVGIFGLEGSPTIITQVDGPAKDPKLQFVSPSAEEFDILQRQMKARIEEGQGETIYEIGVGGRNFSFFIFVRYSLCQGTTKGLLHSLWDCNSQ